MSPKITLPLVEAWALGMFMLSATCFVALFGLPASPLYVRADYALLRRFLIGCAMGLTAVGLIYSPWGRRSGAHMNPAMTLTQWFLGKINGGMAVRYAFAQALGSTAAMFCAAWFFPQAAAPEVNFVQTLPGAYGVGVAFGSEMLISFGLVLLVLYSSNFESTASKTGFFAGIYIVLCITFESPFSGMSMNPARSLASAVAAGHFSYLWIYLLAPPLGMLLAAQVWKVWICQRAEFRCSFQ